MTVNEFDDKIRKNKVPGDAVIMSDSGWECDPTDCSRIFFDEENNVIVLTQDNYPSAYVDDTQWRELY